MAAEAIAEGIDFSGVGRVADIGGGSGGFLARLLERTPSITGILFDQPHVC
jgi:hypothetical protein